MSKWWRSAAGILKSAVELRSSRPYHTIQAIPREISGPRISARDRAQGRIPTVVFSQNYVQTNPNDPTAITASASVSRKLLLTTERKQIKAILKHIKLPFFCSTTFPLQIRAGSGSSTILETKRVLPIKASSLVPCTMYLISYCYFLIFHAWFKNVSWNSPFFCIIFILHGWVD